VAICHDYRPRAVAASRARAPGWHEDGAVQTFLPYRDFARSAQVLDQARLGKQRVETLQVLRALELPEYGWHSHPVVTMWRGRTPALVAYGLACVRAWRALGHADSTEELIGEFAPDVVGATQEELGDAGLLPSWLGDGALHLSHRSSLVRKDPAHYRPVFGDVPDDLPYVWPPADDVPLRVPPAGRDLWVVRPPDTESLGVFVGEGVVGIDASSGVDVDAGGVADDASLRALLAQRAAETGVRRRPGKALRQLTALLTEVRVGDEVAVPVQGGRALLLGEVTGEYAFAGGHTEVPHRRPVRWLDVVPRAAVDRPAVLQDPRSLFRVVLALADEPGDADLETETTDLDVAEVRQLQAHDVVR
jgi:Pyrimidine dimer DNA glycosylase